MSDPPIQALVRPPTAAIERCALTHVDRRPIDVERAVAQHRGYVRALEAAGARTVSLAPEPELPDAPFVEDAALVVGGLAILARPAEALRRRELPSVVRGLSELLAEAGGGAKSGAPPFPEIAPPGTLEGGDVLVAGELIFVGVSGRTNREGARQLREILARHGPWRVIEVPVAGCLHLKTAVTLVAPGLLLANSEWVDASVLRRAARELEVLPVDPREPFAANTLRIGDTLLAPASYPRTLEILERRGLAPRPVDVSELEKAEAGLTCLSLLVEPRARPVRPGP